MQTTTKAILQVISGMAGFLTAGEASH